MKRMTAGSIEQLLKFGLVGVFNTLISLAIYYAFVCFDEGLYLVGNVVGWIVSVANAFFLNDHFVFKNEKRGINTQLKKVAKTYLSYGATFLLNTLLLYLEVDTLSWSPVMCPVLNLLATVPANFVLNKFWTFR